MAKPKKRPELEHCKVMDYAHPRTPWRVWYTAEEHGKKVRRAKAFKGEDAAWIWAENKEKEISNHGVRFGDVPAEARRAYDAFRDACAELTDAGVEPPRFENVVAEAIARMRVDSATISVTAAIRAYLGAKEAEGLSDRHQKDLRLRLSRFENNFGTRALASIATDEIDRWIASLAHPVKAKDRGKPARPVPLGARSKAHYRAKLHALFAYGAARGRRWVASNPVADAVAIKVRKSDRVEIYTPGEIKTIMETACKHTPDLIPVLALGAFAGLRTSEAMRVDLALVDFKSKHLRVTGKTGPRLAFLSPAARAWIATQPRRSGLVWEQDERTLHGRIGELFELDELKKVCRIHNGLRHSFASYRCAVLRSPDAVADEMGNSASVIKTHYRELVSPQQGKAYFATLPPKGPAKVVSIKAAS